MTSVILGGLMIMGMRICDVTIGTLRTILVVQGRKYIAGFAGFVEVSIWIFAIKNIMQSMDNYIYPFFYAGGFALGNVLGIMLEQKIGLGFVQLNVISRHHTDKIANMLRKEKIGVTVLPGEGGSGGVAVLVTIILRKKQKDVVKLIESIDPNAFITVQSSLPYRGYIGNRR